MKDKLLESFFEYYQNALDITSDSPDYFIKQLNILNESDNKEKIKQAGKNCALDKRTKFKLSQSAAAQLDSIAKQNPNDPAIQAAKDNKNLIDDQTDVIKDALRTAVGVERDELEDKLDRNEKSYLKESADFERDYNQFLDVIDRGVVQKKTIADKAKHPELYLNDIYYYDSSPENPEFKITKDKENPNAWIITFTVDDPSKFERAKKLADYFGWRFGPWGSAQSVEEPVARRSNGSPVYKAKVYCRPERINTSQLTNSELTKISLLDLLKGFRAAGLENAEAGQLATKVASLIKAGTDFPVGSIDELIQYSIDNYR